MSGETKSEDHKMKKSSHSNKQDLAGEHQVGDAGQLIFAVLFLTLWVSDSFFL
jgi:hypothetical protein